MPTLSEKCIDHSNVYPNQTGIPPRWLRVLVKSISCSLTSLIIIAAAIILGWFKNKFNIYFLSVYVEPLETVE